MNTEQAGAAKIQEDTDNLKQEFDKLIADLQDVRNKLINRAAQFDDISKVSFLSFDKITLNIVESVSWQMIDNHRNYNI